MFHPNVPDPKKPGPTRWRGAMPPWFRTLITYDVFPEFSARVRRLLYTPLGVLILAALVALLCGLLLHPRVLALCGGLLVVVITGICWPWVMLRGMRARLAFDRERTVEGDPAGVVVTVVNHWPWPAWGLVLREDRGDTSAWESGFALHLRSVLRSMRVRLRWEFTPQRRGEHPLGVPRLVTGFPFGVWESKQRVAVESRLIVWPRTYPVGPVPLADGDDMVEGNVARNKVGSTGDVLGVRPYRRGDSPRRIHWPQTARHDRLIVCELQTTARPVIQLVLDVDPTVHTQGDGSREWAIRIAASFARGWLEAGAQVGVVWHGTVIPPASGMAQVYRILDALSRIPDDSSTPLVDLLTSSPCRSFRAGVQVVITTDQAFGLRKRNPNDQQRWVILSSLGFAGGEHPESNGSSQQHPCLPWLYLDSPSRVAHQLRHGWQEAQHGS